MKKTLLALTMLIGIANATDVAVCQFKHASGFADDKIICSGGNKNTTSIEDMYAEGWKFKGSYNLKDFTYVIMEKGDK